MIDLAKCAGLLSSHSVTVSIALLNMSSVPAPTHVRMWKLVSLSLHRGKLSVSRSLRCFMTVPTGPIFAICLERRFSEGFTKKESSAIFQKKYRAWVKRDQQILLALREIANNSKHFISRELDRFTSGVEAYDFLMTKMSPATADSTASNTDAIERLTNLKLISVKQGGFMKFLLLFQEAVFDLEETGAFVPSPEYQKSLLISKLPSEYHSMTIPSATKGDWDQYVADLMAFSVAIEKKDTKSYKDALNSNVNSDRYGKKLHVGQGCNMDT